MKFRKDDIVKCIDNSQWEDALELNGIYQITKIFEGEMHVSVRVLGGKEITSMFQANRFVEAVPADFNPLPDEVSQVFKYKMILAEPKSNIVVLRRKILFRGQVKESKEWLYGDLISYAGTTQIWVQTDEGKWNYIIDPETSGQFTGFMDNSDEAQAPVYEKDIVQVAPGIAGDPPGFFGVVEMIEGQWVVHNPNLHVGVPLFSESYDIYVVGNIFDSPELLEVK